MVLDPDEYESDCVGFEATRVVSPGRENREFNGRGISMSNDGSGTRAPEADQPNAKIVVVVGETNASNVSATTPTCTKYSSTSEPLTPFSILPPITKEILDDHALYMLRLKQSKSSSKNRPTKKFDARVAVAAVVPEKPWGVPAPMWMLLILFAVAVVVYATARRYNPDIRNDAIEPPYYSITPTGAPLG